MKATYVKDLGVNSSITVVLEEGERLGKIVGPLTFSVPIAPGNAEYDELMASGVEIAEPA